MKKNVIVNLHKFDELSQELQQKAIEEYREFLLSKLSVESVQEQYSCVGDDTPEFVFDMEYNDILYNDDRIINKIVENKYLFFKNGNICK